MKDVRVAAVCMNAWPGEIDKNLRTIQTFAARAADRQVAIICFPELSVTGYILEKPESVCPPSLFKEACHQISETARTSGAVLIAGIIEATEDGGKPYITQIVAGPEGILGRYRKTHLSPPERAAYRGGEEICVYRCPQLTFGVQLCYESHFPEISTLMALKGAEAVFMPHASPRGKPGDKVESWMRHLPARAFDNGLYVIACNQSRCAEKGLSFPGVILALNPSGRVMKKYGGTGNRMLLMELRASEIEEVRSHRMKHFLPWRRPELYADLIQTREGHKRESLPSCALRGQKPKKT
jgi:N-carbamoylputrescine amidase